MSRLRIATIVIAAAAMGVAPATAQATVTTSQVTHWVSSQPGTPADDPYLIYQDNPPTPTLTVQGSVPGASDGDEVDVACFYGPSTGPSIVKLASGVVVHGQQFTSPAVSFHTLVGHACRLRAIPAGTSTENAAQFTGPQIAVSEVESVAIASGPNIRAPYGFYLNGTTFTGSAAWSAAGTPGQSINNAACGGPELAPIDANLSVGNFALDCVGSLLSDDLGAWGGRSEVQVDGRNAYDAAGAQALFPSASGNPASQSLAGFPHMSTTVDWDPASGLISSSSTEDWSACSGPNERPQSYATCQSFVSTGVQVQRNIASSDGGRVVTLTDTWTSTDGQPHTVDLLYDDYVGLSANSAQRGYEFPGEGVFSSHLAGDQVAGPGAAPGTLFVHTNNGASDGNPAEAIGAITFSRAPSGYRFAPSPVPPLSPPPSNEIEEHQVLQLPAGGSSTVSYAYAVGYTMADVGGLARAAQDRFAPPAVTIASPANGAAVSTPTVNLAGTATAGSGITSLVVDGQRVPVSGGTWNASVPLSPGANTITALATDAAGATAQAQVTVVYQPPLPPPPAAQRCNVPKLKDLKLPAAERALRRAHCRVGRIKRLRSSKISRGRVMSTTPRAGRHLAGGARVELFVSRGT